MKGINISCASQASTAIYSSMEQYPSSSSSQPSSLSYSGLQSCGGGRAIDRHNPIITDSKRVTTTLSTPCKYKTPPISPKPNSDSVQKNQNKGNGKKKKKKNTTNNNEKKSRALIDLGKKFNYGNKEGGGKNDYIDYQVKKSVSRPSDLVFMKGCSVKPGDYISPPESSRYLLDDNSHLDVLSDLDHALKWVPDESKIDDDVKKTRADDDVVVEEEAHYSKASKPTSSSNDHQVVDLRVSLHCKGCEGKVRKHISRMKGVTSFNIDFAAKKVTVVGDVTPVGVLASISKVKHAQLWTPPTTTAPTSVEYNRLPSKSTLTGS